MTERYKRQTILPEIGPDGQKKLARASILCIGAGGLGAPALLYLAAAGVGRIGIADFDSVDETNLQRQILFTNAQTGMAKVEAAKAQLAALNPNIEIEVYTGGLTTENAAGLFSRYDMVLDGTDNFAAKYLINDAGVKFSKPVIYGAVNRFEGQAAIFDAARGPCYRCLHPEEPAEKILNCAEAGIIGAAAGMVGIVQAMQAIMLAAPHESFAPLIGKLWTVNTKTMAARLLDLPKDPACPVCSKPKGEIVLRGEAPVCTAVPELSAAEIKQRPEAMIIDVRELYEWEGGHIEGAQHCALSAMMEGLRPEIANDQEIILYCAHGVRSLHAAQMLKSEGYRNVSHLAGGYEAWLAR